MLTDAFLYERLRELTRHYLAPNPAPVHLRFGEPADAGFHEFELSVLESGEDEQGPYWQVLTSLICGRQKGQMGSVYQPLCCSSLVWASGKAEYGVLGNSAVSEAYVAF
jgi:hypothetical protein